CSGRPRCGRTAWTCPVRSPTVAAACGCPPGSHGPHPGGAAAPWRSRRTLAEPPRPGGPPPAHAIPSTYRRVTTRRVAATGEGGVAVARHLPDSPAELSRALAGTGYLPDTGLATAG